VFWTFIVVNSAHSLSSSWVCPLPHGRSVHRHSRLDAIGEVLIDKISSSFGFGVFLLSGGTLLGSVLLEELLVGLGGVARGLDSVDLASLEGLLSADSLLGDHSLDVRGLVVGLVTLLDFTVDDVFADVVELSVESEGVDDSHASLSSESVGSVDIVASGNVLVSLLDNAESNDGKIGAGDASADGLTLALTRSAGSVSSSLLFEKDAGSTIDKDTLLHGETLLVVSSGDSENVALVVVTKVFSVDFIAHSLVEERTDVFLVIDFDFLVSSGEGI